MSSLSRGFSEKVKDVWSFNIDGVPMFTLVSKLKRLKKVLKQINRE